MAHNIAKKAPKASGNRLAQEPQLHKQKCKELIACYKKEIKEGILQINTINKNTSSWKQTKKENKHNLKHGTELNMASLNIKGTCNMDSRKEITKWLEQREIKILALQETHNPNNTTEKHGNYTWFFSGSGKPREYGGVGFVIHNKIMPYIEKVIPINNRIITLTLNTCLKTTIICV